jgi:hypothetical protein
VNLYLDGTASVNLVANMSSPVVILTISTQTRSGNEVTYNNYTGTPGSSTGIFVVPIATTGNHTITLIESYSGNGWDGFGHGMFNSATVTILEITK